MTDTTYRPSDDAIEANLDFARDDLNRTILLARLHGWTIEQIAFHTGLPYGYVRDTLAGA